MSAPSFNVPVELIVLIDRKAFRILYVATVAIVVAIITINGGVNLWK